MNSTQARPEAHTKIRSRSLRRRDAKLRPKTKAANQYRTRDRQELDTLRGDIARTRHWFATNRKILRRSGVTRAVILDSRDITSAQLFIEVANRNWFVGEGLLGAAVCVALVPTYVSLHFLPPFAAVGVFCVAVAAAALSGICFLRRPKYRVRIPFTQWQALPANFEKLNDALVLAVDLSRGHETTNAALIRAIKETEGVTKVTERSLWDEIRIIRRWNRRAA